MSDDLKNRNLADDRRINLNEDRDVAYWTKELGIPAEQLRLLMKANGPMAADIRAALVRPGF